MIRTVTATRYVTPLREGGSLPAIVEADDDGLYVLKFRGAGQGPKALVAELIVGELGRALGLPVPEIVFVDLSPVLGRAEPDPEIQELLERSVGLNLALDYLPGSVAFNPGAAPPVESPLASVVVWFDAYVTNVDRTARNTNLLLWHKRLWLIDHGAALYVHHSWSDPVGHSRTPFQRIADHVLLPYADAILEQGLALAATITDDLLRSIVALVPEDWLNGDSTFANIEEHRDAYVAYLQRRRDAAETFVEEAVRARARIV